MNFKIILANSKMDLLLESAWQMSLNIHVDIEKWIGAINNAPDSDELFKGRKGLVIKKLH